MRSRVIETRQIQWREADWLQNETLKKLDERSLAKLKQSLLDNQFVMPFHVWQDGEAIWILDGHHRQQALHALEADGIEVPAELPATFLDCSDRRDAARLVLVFSSSYAKLTESGLADFLEMFDLEIEEVEDMIDLPDFSMPRYEQRFGDRARGEGAPSADDLDLPLPKLSEAQKVIVSPGDIFCIGTHRIACADCNDAEVWRTLLDGSQVDMIFTDPPYNLKADTIGNLGEVQHADFAMAAGEMSEEQFKDWLQEVFSTMASVTRSGSLHYVCMDWRHVWHVTEAARAVYGSQVPKQLCVWNKNQAGMGSFYRSKHELVFIFKSGKEAHTSNVGLSDRVRNNVWDYPMTKAWSSGDAEQMANHPTPKPTDLVEDAIRDSTHAGDLVADFFLGSGTTLMAADRAGRRCVATELEPSYTQLSILRYLIGRGSEGADQIDFEHLNGELTLKDFIALID